MTYLPVAWSVKIMEKVRVVCLADSDNLMCVHKRRRRFFYFFPIFTFYCIVFRLHEKTYSLWGYMWQNLPDYVNPFYKDGSHGVLRPSSSPQQLRWVQLLIILPTLVCGESSSTERFLCFYLFVGLLKVESIENTKI